MDPGTPQDPNSIHKGKGRGVGEKKGRSYPHQNAKPPAISNANTEPLRRTRLCKNRHRKSLPHKQEPLPPRDMAQRPHRHGRSRLDFQQQPGNLPTGFAAQPGGVGNFGSCNKTKPNILLGEFGRQDIFLKKQQGEVKQEGRQLQVDKFCVCHFVVHVHPSVQHKKRPAQTTFTPRLQLSRQTAIVAKTPQATFTTNTRVHIKSTFFRIKYSQGTTGEHMESDFLPARCHRVRV